MFYSSYDEADMVPKKVFMAGKCLFLKRRSPLLLSFYLECNIQFTMPPSKWKEEDEQEVLALAKTIKDKGKELCFDFMADHLNSEFSDSENVRFRLSEIFVF